jgi:hypothetical protein
MHHPVDCVMSVISWSLLIFFLSSGARAGDGAFVSSSPCRISTVLPTLCIIISDWFRFFHPPLFFDLVKPNVVPPSRSCSLKSHKSKRGKAETTSMISVFGATRRYRANQRLAGLLTLERRNFDVHPRRTLRVTQSLSTTITQNLLKQDVVTEARREICE